MAAACTAHGPLRAAAVHLVVRLWVRLAEPEFEIKGMLVVTTRSGRKNDALLFLVRLFVGATLNAAAQVGGSALLRRVVPPALAAEIKDVFAVTKRVAAGRKNGVPPLLVPGSGLAAIPGSAPQPAREAYSRNVHDII